MEEVNRGEIVRAVTSAGVQAVGVVSPGWGIAAAAGKEMLDPLLTRLAARVLTRVAERVDGARLRKVAEVLHIGSERSGLDPDSLVDRVGRDDTGDLLLTETLEAAVRTAHEAKIAALGQVLANAASDGARVDEERIVVAALAQLEAPHIQVLAVIAQLPPIVVMQGQPVSRRGWTRTSIGNHLPGHIDVLDPVLAVLSSTGLVAQVDLGQQPASVLGPRPRGPMSASDSIWALTGFGQLCLERLQAAPDAEMVDG